VALAIPREVAAVLAELKPLMAGLKAALDVVASRLAGLSQALASPGGGPGPQPAPAAGPGKAPQAGGGPGLLGGALSGANAALSALAGPASLATSGLAQVAGATSLVTAAAPGIVEMMTLAFRDLSAVLGTALIPIVEAAAHVFRQVGDVLLPVMQQIQPAIRELANIVKSVIIPIFQVWATIISDVVLPLFQALAPVLEFLATAFRTVAAVVQAVVMSIAQAVGAAFGADLRTAMDDFRKALRQLAVGAAVAVGVLAKFFGADEFLKNYIQVLEGGRRGNSQNLAAIQDVHTSGLQDVVRGLQEAAAKAAGAAGGGPAADPLVEAVAHLKGIRDGTSNLEEIIVRALRRVGTQANRAAGEVINNAIPSALTPTVAPIIADVGMWLRRRGII
jgi:hypothetical protein